MNTLNRSAIVPYSAQQMFELVNQIEAYPVFLPWCDKSVIISRDQEMVVAELQINWKGIHKSFTTRNRLYPYLRMEITLVEGPLKHLQGNWHFHALSEQACKVILDLEFEFTGNFIDKLFQPVFQHIANTLVEAFTEYADKVYDPK